MVASMYEYARPYLYFPGGTIPEHTVEGQQTNDDDKTILSAIRATGAADEYANNPRKVFNSTTLPQIVEREHMIY